MEIWAAPTHAYKCLKMCNYFGAVLKNPAWIGHISAELSSILQYNVESDVAVTI